MIELPPVARLAANQLVGRYLILVGPIFYVVTVLLGLPGNVFFKRDAWYIIIIYIYKIYICPRTICQHSHSHAHIYCFSYYTQWLDIMVAYLVGRRRSVCRLLACVVCSVAVFTGGLVKESILLKGKITFFPS